MEKQSLELAYNESLKTYDWMSERSTSHDQGLRALIIWGTTLNIGVLSLIVQKSQCPLSVFCNLFFIGAVVLFLFAIIAVFVGIYTKGLTLIDPQRILHGNWLNVPSEEFMRDSITDASTNFDNNARYLKMKFKCAVISALLYCAGLVFLIIWSSTLG